MSPNHTKTTLRAQARQIREMLSPEIRADASTKIAHRLLAMKAIAQAQCIAAYVGFDQEVATDELIHGLLALGKNVVLPRVIERDNTPALDWHVIHEFPGALVANRFGILEPTSDTEPIHPSAIDLFIVPGLLFDLRGHRLGFGCGYYDRTFAAAPDARRIAICYEAQIVRELPAEPHDVPMHAILTEKDLRRFANFPA